MTYDNARFKNSGNDEGDVLAFFQNKMRNLIQENGGDHSFSWIMEEATNKDCPMPVGTKTRIKLTHTGHTITQVEKSFVTFKVDITLRLQFGGGFNIKCAGYDHLLKLFVGFKNAVEFFEDCRFWINGKLLDTYRQDQLQRESFAYNTLKPRDAKATAKFSHSLWENVAKFSPSVCGCYVDIKDLLAADGQTPKDTVITMELTVPFNDQLALQAWQLYPNSICGEIEEEIKTSLSALVWAQVPISAVKEVEEFLNNRIYDLHSADQATINITRRFSQIGDGSNIVSTFRRPATADEVLPGNHALMYTGADNTGLNRIFVKVGFASLYAIAGTIQLARSNLAGFGLKPNVLSGLNSLLQNPILVPAQELTREIFEGTAKPNGIEVSKSMLLRNATNITMMFPRRPIDITCFENIMYQNVQLIVNKRTYPDTEFATTCDARFYQHQLVANELDGMLECTKEFERSYTQPINDLKTGAKYSNNIADATSFGINFQLERSNAGYVFDGLSYENPVTVTFRGQPMFNGNNDQYYNVGGGGHPPAPEAWICSDSYWIWSTNGVEYVSPANVPTSLM